MNKKQLRLDNLALLRKQVPKYARYLAPVYKLLKWEWKKETKGKYVPYIPSVKDIEKTLYSLIESMKDVNLMFADTCGLRVTYQEASIKDDRMDDECHMSFVIDCWSYEGNENA